MENGTLHPGIRDSGTGLLREMVAMSRKTARPYVKQKLEQGCHEIQFPFTEHRFILQNTAHNGP